MPKTEQEIRQIELMWQMPSTRGYRPNSILFDQDLAGFSSTRHERLHGLEAMRNTFSYYLERSESMEFALDQVEVHQYGETAVSTFYWSIFMKTASGEHEITGRGSHVFVRRNGDWKIVHEHFSRAQHPPELWDTSPENSGFQHSNQFNACDLPSA